MNKEKQIWEQPGYDFDPPYPASTPVITHYDLLISKTPEELAEWLIKEAYFCADPKRFCSDEPCLPCVVSWLKSPVEVDDD